MSVILGLDFGGTKLAAGVYDLGAGALSASRRQATPPGGAPASIAAMLAMARELLAEAGQGAPAGVGVSFGGPVEADGRIVRLSMHVPGWERRDLASAMERELGAPTRVANDGDAAALAEHKLGAGRGVGTLIYTTVSTGVGGGVVIGGRIHRGEHAWAGEIGHMLLDPNGPPCPCGRNGCLESLASGLSIARDARQALRERPERASLLRAGPVEQVDARLVAEAASQGDALARGIWDTAMAWLGRGLASAANLLNPGTIVVGGGLTRAGALLFDPVRREAARRALDPQLVIVPAELGDDVGILGGVALWLDS